jgi:hypothetical protein
MNHYWVVVWIGRPEVTGVPFKDDVWSKFLRDNAVRVFGL